MGCIATNAERQQRYREKLKAEGVQKITVKVTSVANTFLRECYESAWNPGDTFEEFCERALVRGAAFTANTGKGRGKRGLPPGALRRNVRSLKT